jgi:deferrochelatase/peroxidase EfeB
MSVDRLRLVDRGPGWSYRPDDRAPSIFAEHQPGIATPQLDHAAMASFDLSGDLAELLRAWSREAEQLMRARPGAATATFGLGPTVFERAGLAGRRPVALRELPAFPGDAIDPAICGGDLLVMVCADAAASAAEALRRLVSVAGAAMTPRWRQDGFVHRERGRGPARDLLGFRDGTMNLRRGRDFDRHVWVGQGDRPWMAGGTYMVVRRIRILIDDWERMTRAEQEAVVGRQRESGAPLGRRREFDPVPLEAMRDGRPLIPLDAHARVATPRTNGGVALLRRSYSYDNGADASRGASAGGGGPSGGGRDAGLLFVCFQRDPRRQFVQIQRRLAEQDALSRFTRHVGSAVFAIPPGARPGGFVGDSLRAGG